MQLLEQEEEEYDGEELNLKLNVDDLSAVIEDAAEVITPAQIFLAGAIVGKSHGRITI